MQAGCAPRVGGDRETVRIDDPRRERVIELCLKLHEARAKADLEKKHVSPSKIINTVARAAHDTYYPYIQNIPTRIILRKSMFGPEKDRSMHDEADHLPRF